MSELKVSGMLCRKAFEISEIILAPSSFCGYRIRDEQDN